MEEEQDFSSLSPPIASLMLVSTTDPSAQIVADEDIEAVAVSNASDAHLFGDSDDAEEESIQDPNEDAALEGANVSEIPQKDSDSNDEQLSAQLTPDELIVPKTVIQSPNVISKHMHPTPLPDTQKRYAIMRFPSILSYAPGSWDDVASSPYNVKDSNVGGVAFSPTYEIRWHYKRDENGKILLDEESNLMYESNTNLVQWDDGSFTLFVDNQPFDCELRQDETYLFEASQEEVKPLHLVVKERLQIREIDLLQASARRFRKFKSTAQRTKLTTSKEAETMQLMTQRALENKRDADKMRRKQNDATKESGLTGSFLESDLDE